MDACIYYTEKNLMMWHANHNNVVKFYNAFTVDLNYLRSKNRIFWNKNIPVTRSYTAKKNTEMWVLK